MEGRRRIEALGDHLSEAFEFRPDFRLYNSRTLADLEAKLREVFFA